MNTRHARARAVLMGVVILMALRIQVVMAHAGHAHKEEGLDLTTTLGVTGVVAALGIALLLTNRISRARGMPGEDDGPGMT